jgi:hypothetical protein
MDKIEEGKKYRTGGGLPIMIYAMHAGGDYPIHGAFRQTNGRWEVASWTQYGKNRTSPEWDMVPVPERFVRERWVNVYTGGESIHDCKWSADNACKQNTYTRIACVPVKVEGTEGDGLED